MSKYIPLDKLLFLSPWLQGRGRCLNTAAVTVYTSDVAKMWPWCICRIWFLHETGAMKCLRRAQVQMEFGIFTCHCVLQGFQLWISSSVRLWVWLVLQEQAQAEAGQGDGHVLCIGNGKGLQTVSKAKGSSTTLPNNLAWFMLNKSVIYAQATCSST